MNGPKFTNSRKFTYKEPSTDQLIKRKDVENQKTKLGLNTSISLAEEIQKEIDIIDRVIEKNLDLPISIIKSENKVVNQKIDLFEFYL